MNRQRPATLARPSMLPLVIALAALTSVLAAPAANAADLPVTSAQRATAQQVAGKGIALSELSPKAPDSYIVKPGDSLWEISGLFLKSAWRWPELWGMNLNDIRNPHLIYPGQVLYLDKTGGVARLRVGQNVGGRVGGTVKLSPRARDAGSSNVAIAAVPMHVIAPFLNEAVILEEDELAAAPRIVAAPENRVLMSRGDTAYVRGDVRPGEYRMFRQVTPLRDPDTKEVLGYEAAFVGTADFVKPGSEQGLADGKLEIVPSTFKVTSTRQEAGVGDRLSPVPPRDYSAYAPHAPSAALNGRVISVYGEALNGGQNQIVVLNRGATNGIERGQVLALYRDGTHVVDRTDATRPLLKLPNERHGLLYVFRTSKRLAYALVLSVEDPVRAGDRFSQP